MKKHAAEGQHVSLFVFSARVKKMGWVDAFSTCAFYIIRLMRGSCTAAYLNRDAVLVIMYWTASSGLRLLSWISREDASQQMIVKS